MFILFIFLYLFSLSSLQDSTQIIIDTLFKYRQLDYISFSYCPMHELDNFHYMGRPTNIKDIINLNKIDENKNIENYKSVYINEFSYMQSITSFSNSTIFFVNPNIFIEDNYNKDYCYFVDYFGFETLSHFYIVIYKEMSELLLENTIQYLIIFAIINIFFLIIFISKSCNNRLITIYTKNVAIFILFFCLINIFSCIIISNFLPAYCLYSFYKSYIFTHLFILLNGYSIIHNNFRVKKKQILLLLLLIYEILTTLIFEYIIYFIPSFDNFFLFAIRNFLEHILLFILAIKSFKNIFMKLYQQYRFERRFRTILTLGYRMKIIIYIKVIIFSVLYSLGFIILYIIIIVNHIYYYVDGFFLIYYFNIGLELTFGMIFAILFFPSKISIFYFSQVNYDYESLKFIADIKDKNIAISRLKKNILNNCKEKEYPLVFIGPFIKTDNPFDNLHIGMIKK